jgi:molecular chaperone GrpE
MNNDAKKKRAPEQDNAPQEAPVEAGEARNGAAEETQAEHEAFMRLVKENEELKDARLRLAAEMENLRRRTQRELQETRAYAIANFARDMLAVSDNLRRALEAIPAEARQAGNEGFSALVEGVEMTERAMLAAFERHGVRRLEPLGERFDPNLHQAMFEVEDPNVAAGTVVQVMQAGYRIGDRVLRPAMVGVSKGGPREASAPQPQASETDNQAEPGPVNAQAEKDA